MNERHEEMRQMRREIDPSYTLEEIGERFGVTRERVRQVTEGVSPGRDVERALATALPLYAPIEVEIVNPWGVKELCQRCLRPAVQETAWGPACAACQTSVRLHNDPNYREIHRKAQVKYHSGPCPRPTDRCKSFYRDVLQHVLCFSHHEGEREELWRMVREAKGLPEAPLPERWSGRAVT